MLHASHHHPPHIFKNNTIYFITARTIDKQNFFNTDKKKSSWCLCLKAGLQRFLIDLYSWVMLDNHYHLLLKISKTPSLSKFINFLNGRSSYELNCLENMKGRKVWYEYWDHCIRNEADFFRHFNYIHQNPIKHKSIKNLDKLNHYEFSSFNQTLNKKGEEWILDCFEKYPIKDFVEKSDV